VKLVPIVAMSNGTKPKGAHLGIGTGDKDNQKKVFIQKKLQSWEKQPDY
jgi:hypothetical protein